MGHYEFKFTHLPELKDDMVKKQRTVEQFGFSFKNVAFDNIFIINQDSFEMLIGAVGYNKIIPLMFSKDFVTELPTEYYIQLCNILNLSWSQNHFSSFTFLQYVDAHVPPHCTTIPVQPNEIARFRTDIPESEKIYFYGWNPHYNGSGVSPENLKKTRLLLGEQVANHCERHNISSKWTDRQGKWKLFFNPPGFALS